MTRTIKRTVGPAVMAAAGLLVLAGCGSGLNPQTYAYRAAANSTSVDAGPLSVRHVYVQAPRDAKTGYAVGTSADVVLSAATRADKDDRLVSATSPLASSVTVPGDLVVKVGQLMLDRHITLVGLTKQLRSSDYVPLTLTFASGATVAVNTPVEVTTDPPDTRPGFEEPDTDSNGTPITHVE